MFHEEAGRELVGLPPPNRRGGVPTLYPPRPFDSQNGTIVFSILNFKRRLGPVDVDDLEERNRGVLLLFVKRVTPPAVYDSGSTSPQDGDFSPPLCKRV